MFFFSCLFEIEPSLKGILNFTTSINFIKMIWNEHQGTKIERLSLSIPWTNYLWTTEQSIIQLLYKMLKTRDGYFKCLTILDFSIFIPKFLQNIRTTFDHSYFISNIITLHIYSLHIWFSLTIFIFHSYFQKLALPWT